MGAWLLSNADFDQRPWVIIDYKHDSLLNSIDGIEHIKVKEPPEKPGLYITHPLPHEQEAVDDFFFQIWGKENCGLFIDEAFMTPNYRRYAGYNSLLTQGRSKNIPIISCTQRPAWISPFVFSESDYFSVFHLNTRTDQKKVEEFVPADISEILPEFHSHWYDVKRNRKFLMTPVPNRDTILQKFSDKLAAMRENGKRKVRFI